MQMIFGKLTGEPTDRPSMTLAPPSPYAPHMPMQTHPSQCQEAEHWGQYRYTFRDHISVVEDTVLAEKRKTPQRGMEWGEYMTLRDEGERLTTASLAFFADCFMSYPSQLPTLQDRNVCVLRPD